MIPKSILSLLQKIVQIPLPLFYTDDFVFCSG